jgi:predicted SprT family Zn-dependent metalloprotease
MTPSVAQTLARELMNTHGLAHWTFQFDASRKRFGGCHFRTQKITLSIDLTMRAEPRMVYDTILHEIAHAIAGPRAGHSEQWKQVARSIGCSAMRCFSYGDGVEPVPGEWQAVCGNCSKTYHMHREPKSKQIGAFKYCRNCGQIKGRLTFNKVTP